jgi:phosphohistidine phosphatase
MRQVKTLILTRHAKSSWTDISLSDQMRPLNKRGLSYAPKMGDYLASLEVLPQLIVSSPAVRAFTTAKLMGEKFGIQADDILRDDSIYMAYPNELMDCIHNFNNTYNNIMLVGHNPTITKLVNMLTGSDIANIPTCGVAIIRFNTEDWQKIGHKNSELLEYVYPKLISNYRHT